VDLLGDLWTLFGPAPAPGVLWCAAGAVLPFLGAVTVLVAVVLSAFGREG
jgi:hypothetical protein